MNFNRNCWCCVELVVCSLLPAAHCGCTVLFHCTLKCCKLICCHLNAEDYHVFLWRCSWLRLMNNIFSSKLMEFPVTLHSKTTLCFANWMLFRRSRKCWGNTASNLQKKWWPEMLTKMELELMKITFQSCKHHSTVTICEATYSWRKINQLLDTRGSRYSIAASPPMFFFFDCHWRFSQI